MANVFDVAAYILKKKGTVTAMKLQKLVYYSQAWSLVWDERPIFADQVEAWANGPVVPHLYDWHRGLYNLTSCAKGNPDALTDQERATMEAVLQAYGDQSSQWLSDLTHSEEPWKAARKGLAPGQWGPARSRTPRWPSTTARCRRWFAGRSGKPSRIHRRKVPPVTSVDGTECSPLM